MGGLRLPAQLTFRLVRLDHAGGSTPDTPLISILCTGGTKSGKVEGCWRKVEGGAQAGGHAAQTHCQVCPQLGWACAVTTSLPNQQVKAWAELKMKTI